ncbi:hypothetical protein M011DRAFT_455457 [Sporormia fimetaria CBS 119925]|uniref:Uncharacterized protein n=1 Tax=Sporormia fimetaria CBS 119925 TaxID=1340428 RepID=A0A6A6VQA2_9PLEO|nr:hypothetical protein M011DRAFT_455457 [Sporormia fimetaria CBS 119925]
MALRPPVPILARAFSSTTRARATLQHLNPYANTRVATLSAPAKLGPVARWYLPAMAALAVGLSLIPSDLLLTTPDAPTAHARIGFAITNFLGTHNQRQNPVHMTQEERNRRLMEAYGSRSSLEDMERAFDLMGHEGLEDTRLQMSMPRTGLEDTRLQARGLEDTRLQARRLEDTRLQMNRGSGLEDTRLMMNGGGIEDTKLGRRGLEDTRLQSRNLRLMEAYGEKRSLRDLERAMEIYEVQ